MLDEHLRPWLLEVNSTPHLWRCDHADDVRGGAVVTALEDLLANVLEPVLRPRTRTAPMTFGDAAAAAERAARVGVGEVAGPGSGWVRVLQ